MQVQVLLMGSLTWKFNFLSIAIEKSDCLFYFYSQYKFLTFRHYLLLHSILASISQKGHTVLVFWGLTYFNDIL